MRQKVVYILSQVDKAVAFEWIVEEIDKKKFELIFILINDRFDTPFSRFLKSKKVEFYTYPLKTKLYYPITALKLAFRLKSLGKIIVHAHLFEGGLIGLTAAKLAGVKTRIFTRHHSTSHQEYFPKAVKYDKLNNFLATKIIAISNNVKQVLIENENVNPEKIEVVEHCFRLKNFKIVSDENVIVLRGKHKLPANKITIGTISRYVELKGVEYVIEAFKAIHSKYPNTHLLLANSGGNYEAVIKERLSQLPSDSYTEIKFEPNLYALYHLMDIFCHVPINSKVEAFGQTYVEALASGIPSIYTLSGIANDFIVDQENALLVDYRNSEQIKEAIELLIEDNELKNKLISNGLESVQRFELSIMIKKLSRLYLS